MKKRIRMVHGICVLMIFFFAGDALMPVCHAQINISPVNGGETTSVSPVKKVTHTTSGNENFFDLRLSGAHSKREWIISLYFH
jgi:hypothetical protein